MQKYFKNAPDGIPGNDDTGTMSAWAIFNMMGFYPDCPGEPAYTLSTPVFDKVTIKLDPCLLYTSDAADDLPCVDIGGRRNHKKKKKNTTTRE